MVEPRLRFKQANGSNYPKWSEMPLGSIVSDNLDPVPTPKEGYRRVGVYCHAKGTFQEDVPAEKVLDVDTMYRIHKNNLIVNITFAWEHAVAIVKSEDEGLLVSHRFPEYSFNEGQNPIFYKYLVQRPYFRNQMSLASPGGAGRNRVLNKAQFKMIPVIVPCEEEQQKIADFLSSVDEVIAASEEEVANLETQKKAVMKKIFSQEVRFKRDDGSDFPEWMTSKLKFVCNDFIVPMRDKPKVFDGDIPWCRIEDIKGKYFNTSLSGQYVSEKTVKEMNLKIHPAGTVICSCSASLGTYAIAKQNLITNQTFIGLVCSDSVINEFLLYYMMTQTEQLKKEAGGTTILYVSREKFENLDVFVPCLEEQHLIADFLSDFDEAITAAKKELELWNELKKGLLQQMFV